MQKSEKKQKKTIQKLESFGKIEIAAKNPKFCY